MRRNTVAAFSSMERMALKVVKSRWMSGEVQVKSPRSQLDSWSSDLAISATMSNRTARRGIEPSTSTQLLAITALGLPHNNPVWGPAAFGVCQDYSPQVAIPDLDLAGGPDLTFCAIGPPKVAWRSATQPDYPPSSAVAPG
jgi:hypothetical protein